MLRRGRQQHLAGTGLHTGLKGDLDVQLVVVAVAEGTKAAFAINKALLAESGLA